MAESLQLPSSGDRVLIRQALAPQLRSLLIGETDHIAAMANVTAALSTAFGWHWVGFYRVIGDQLVLGPFQGPVACTRIGKGKGVCGAAWQEERTIIVPDVDQFPGHIACSALSRSEIVVPVRDKAGVVKAVLDVDSVHLNDLDDTDAEFLEMVCRSFEPIL